MLLGLPSCDIGGLVWLVHALLTFGKKWHGYPFAVPHSAKLGVEAGQAEPGYGFIRAMERVGLTWDVQGPEDQPARDGLQRVAEQAAP